MENHNFIDYVKFKQKEKKRKKSKTKKENEIKRGQTSIIRSSGGLFPTYPGGQNKSRDKRSIFLVHLFENKTKKLCCCGRQSECSSLVFITK